MSALVLNLFINLNISRNLYLKKFADIIQENHDIITKNTKSSEIIKIKYISNAQDKEGFLNNLKKCLMQKKQ